MNNTNLITPSLSHFNAPPMVMDDVVETLINVPAIILSSKILANDQDPDNQSIKLVGLSNAVNGKVTINRRGNIVFVPNNNYQGQAEFTYTVRDSSGLTTRGKVTVNVNQLQKMDIGTNLTGVSDWSPQLPFIDAFKFSRNWLWDGAYNKINTNLDQNGWLTSVKPPSGVSSQSLATTILFTGMVGSYPLGKYVVLYDGKGNLTYKYGASKNEALSSPGRDVIDVVQSNSGLFLQITNTDPAGAGDYIRNIRIIPAAYENNYTNLYSGQPFNPTSANIFNPTFLSRIKPFSTVRFMDWMDTNGSYQSNWSNRPTLTDAQWSSNDGVPVEVMVALAQQAKVNPWFTMPHMADDDYVRNFALYVKNNLAPDKKIYVEYSNEVWNPLFPQYHWVNQEALKVGLNKTEWFAQRSAQVIKIWKDVFGTQSSQIVGVLGAQASDITLSTTAINYLKNTGDISAIDALAIAPYFGGYLGTTRYASQVKNFTLDELFDELTQGGVVKSRGRAAVPGGALQQSYKWMESNAVLARQNNLQLLAYEGGQHLVANIEANRGRLTNLFIAANRDRRMGELYKQYLSKWNQLGGGLFVNFSDITKPSRWGSWGAMENLNDVNNPKYSALMQMVQSKA
ncbi:MAG: cadherin-like domain-containing protein [Chlorogloea purpurea SAG 13.99]|nr:cadherin-like domain-containing protein [Chlorogloea purpurea SAG 13.99]